jgi:hypothetical protein
MIKEDMRGRGRKLLPGVLSPPSFIHCPPPPLAHTSLELGKSPVLPWTGGDGKSGHIRVEKETEAQSYLYASVKVAHGANEEWLGMAIWPRREEWV